MSKQLTVVPKRELAKVVGGLIGVMVIPPILAGVLGSLGLAVVVGVISILFGLVGVSVLVSRWEVVLKKPPTRAKLPKARLIE